MRFCKWCGKEIKDNIKFCPDCGKSNDNFKEVNDKLIIENDLNEKKEEILSEESKINKEINLDKNNKVNQLTLDKPKMKKQSIQVEKEFNKKEKKSNTKIVVAGILGCALIGGILIYCFYDDILFSKYTKNIKATTNIEEKFQNYDKIISLGKYDEIKKSMLGLIAVDVSYLGYIENMESISKEEKDDIMKTALVALAEERYLDGEFYEAKNALDRANKYGYSITEELYKRIEGKLEGDNTYIKDQDVENETNIENTGFYINDSHLRYLEENELKKYDKDELAIIRNEIYARHGYVFNQEPFKSYFNSQAWYIPNGSFKGSDVELNAYEKENVQLLLRLEKER